MTRHSTALFFVLLVSACADTLTLRNGTAITGSYVSIDAKDVSFRVGDEMNKYPRTDVAKLTFEPLAPPASAHAQSDGQKKPELGMTKAEVDALLPGQPGTLQADAGTKQIYLYGDLKVTFVGGKVSAVQ